MNFNRGRGSSIIVRLTAVLVIFSAATSAQTVDKKAVLKQARQSYYSLTSEGLAEFGCTLEPNWDRVLADTKKTNPAGAEAAVRKLNQLHFQMTIAPGSDAKVTHNELSAENATMADGLKQIYSGMEQMTVGFFQTWTVFVMTPSLPDPESDYQLEDLGTSYRLTYKEGAATDVMTTMGKNMIITSIKVNTKNFQSTLWPQFIRTPGGLLLSGYQATYAGATPAETTELKVDIDYQTAGGFQVPKKMNVKGSYGGSPFDVEVAFTNCQATSRQTAQRD